MDKLTHSVRRQQWLNVITAWQSHLEDITAKQWLKDNRVKEKAYYYWLRKFHKGSLEQIGNIPSDNRILFLEIHL